MYKAGLINCIFLLLAGLSLPAQEDFNWALELAQKGSFDEAAAIYENQIRLYGPTADLYFNLGTVYLQANKIALSRIALEKALRLDPGNKSVQTQLEILKQKIDPQIDALPSFLPYRWFIQIRNELSVKGWGWVLLGLSWVTMVGVMVRRKGTKRYFSPLILLWWLLLGFSALAYYSGTLNRNEPFFVLMQDHPLHIAPDSSSQVLIPLGEGSKAQLLDSLGAWYKVILENNDQGWLPKVSLNNN